MDQFNHHSLYGVIPIIHSKLPGSSVVTGFLWANSSDTFVDIFKKSQKRTAHWFSESGKMEFCIFPSNDPKTLTYKQMLLTGKMPMPNIFSLGYH